MPTHANIWSRATFTHSDTLANVKICIHTDHTVYCSSVSWQVNCTHALQIGSLFYASLGFQQHGPIKFGIWYLQYSAVSSLLMGLDPGFFWWH